MTRYADPQRCPDCHGPIQYGEPSCSHCELPLAGPVAAQLFRTLTRADELLATLRDSRLPAVPLACDAPEQDAPATPATLAATPSRGLGAASVPRILLGLGAVCLLVAALVFLAVSWAAMGVAGRTATLLGCTVLTAVLTGWLARRDLRAAAEALSLVTLGLLAFDLFGARESGWFGQMETPAFLVLLGAVVALAAAVAAIGVRRTAAGELAGSEVVAALGVALVCAGLVGTDWFSASAALVVGVALAGAAALVGQGARLVIFAVATSAVTGCVWLALLGSSVLRALAHPNGRELWLELEGWPLLAAALLVAVPAGLRTVRTEGRVGLLAVAGLVLAAAVLAPASDAPSTQQTLAVAVVVVGFGALTWFVRGTWARAPLATVLCGGAWLLLVGGVLSVAAAGRMAAAGARVWSGRPDGRLDGFDGPLAPWLLPVVLAVLAGTVVVAARVARRADRVLAAVANVRIGGAAAGAVAALTVALYPVPVALLTAVLLTIALGLTAWALSGQDLVSLVLGGGFLGIAVAVSLYDEWLTAVALLVAVATSTAALVRLRGSATRLVMGGVLAASTAGLLWTAGALAGAERPWTALVTLLALAGLALLVPVLLGRDLPGVEAGAGLAAVVVGVAGAESAPIAQAADWTAVYLTVAGVAVTALSLLRTDRRELGWLGGPLLAAASWVRLWDVGVQSPEAYTVPSAFALLVVGVAHLRRNPRASTVSALAPGLGLALVPSLLWVLVEPATTRAVLLGAACLLLVAVGVRLRWTAPVLFGATVALLVVLRNAVPFVDQAVPRWVLIATAGAVLIGAGVSWERRVQEMRALTGYVRGLR